MDPVELDFIRKSIVGFGAAFTFVLISDFAYRHTDEKTRRLITDGVGNDIVVALLWFFASLPLVFALWLPFRTMGVEPGFIIAYYALMAAAVGIFYYHWDFLYFWSERKGAGLAFAGIGLTLVLAALIVFSIAIFRVWSVEPFASTSRISGALAPTFAFVHFIMFGIVFLIYVAQSNFLPSSVADPFLSFGRARGKAFKSA